MTTSRRTLAAITALMVAVGWPLVVTQALLYTGEFNLTTVALAGAGGQRQFLGITAALAMFFGYMSLVLLLDAPEQPADAPAQK